MVSDTALPVADPRPRHHPFDAAAASYDAAFTNTRLGRWYRGMVWAQLDRVFGEGDHVLELGCGTGEDAVWLARRGVRVTATDPSSAMLETACAKARSSGVEGSISFQRLDLNDGSNLSELASEARTGERFDGAIANFGPLNCVRGRSALAEQLARAIRPGGRLVLTVMGPLCPWELVWHSLRFEFGTANRRLHSGREASVGEGGTLRVWYPSVSRLENEFGQYFHPVDRVGLGLLLPPSGMARLVDRFPRLFRVLAVLDRRCARLRPWLWLNDHYLLVMERRSK